MGQQRSHQNCSDGPIQRGNAWQRESVGWGLGHLFATCLVHERNVNLKYGYMRAKSRAVVAAAGAALVVVPLTGAAAVALVGNQEPELTVVPDQSVVAQQSAQYGEAIAASSTVIAAPASADFDLNTPTIKVKENPPPPPPPPAPSTNRAQPVANSSDVQAAIDGSAIVAEAAKHVGTPYQSGGSSPGGFDCSGFVSYVYAQFGISLPRTSGGYYNVGTQVSSPQPGDIIVSPGHVGIYAGPDLQIDSPTTGKTIQFRSIWQNNPVYIRVT